MGNYLLDEKEKTNLNNTIYGMGDDVVTIISDSVGELHLQNLGFNLDSETIKKNADEIKEVICYLDITATKKRKSLVAIQGITAESLIRCSPEYYELPSNLSSKEVAERLFDLIFSNKLGKYDSIELYNITIIQSSDATKKYQVRANLFNGKETK